MSTNYFILTKDKSLCEKYELNYELTDEPDWGYWIHICQTTSFLTPLWQAHIGVDNVDKMKELINEPNCTLYDEYLREVNKDEFMQEVMIDSKNNKDLTSRKEYTSQYCTGISVNTGYFVDKDGYEFYTVDFR